MPLLALPLVIALGHGGAGATGMPAAGSTALRKAPDARIAVMPKITRLPVREAGTGTEKRAA